MARCVICGKVSKGSVSASHLKTHKVVAAAYAANAAKMGPRAWEFYWSHPGVQAKFPNPTAAAPSKGMKFTYKRWFGKVGLGMMLKAAKAAQAVPKAAPKAVKKVK